MGAGERGGAAWVPVSSPWEGGEGRRGAVGVRRGALAGPWLTAVLLQNSLMQELESSQRQIEEQQNHKVPGYPPACQEGAAVLGTAALVPRPRGPSAVP